MALAPCPECQREISDAAVSCPHCGHPLGAATPKGAGSARTGILIFVAICVIGLVVAMLVAPRGSDDRLPKSAAEALLSPVERHYNAGLQALMDEKATLAETEFASAVAADPKCLPAWVNLAAARLKLVNGPGAEEAARRAVELYASGDTGTFRTAGDSPESLGATAYGNLAAALTVQLKSDEATNAARRALELDPRHARAANWRAILEAQ